MRTLPSVQNVDVELGSKNISGECFGNDAHRLGFEGREVINSVDGAEILRAVKGGYVFLILYLVNWGPVLPIVKGRPPLAAIVIPYLEGLNPRWVLETFDAVIFDALESEGLYIIVVIEVNLQILVKGILIWGATCLRSFIGNPGPKVAVILLIGIAKLSGSYTKLSNGDVGIGWGKSSGVTFVIKV